MYSKQLKFVASHGFPKLKNLLKLQFACEHFVNKENHNVEFVRQSFLLVSHWSHVGETSGPILGVIPTAAWAQGRIRGES